MSRGAIGAAVTLTAMALSLVGCEGLLPEGATGLPRDTTPQVPVDTLPTPIPIQEWLDTNSATIRSASFADTDFSDLEAVAAAIGNARVVMLGSQTRYDGSASQAQARLVRFLHEELGFSVLAFESGLFDMAESWASIGRGENAVSAGQAGVAVHWGSTEELQPLFAYVGEQAVGAAPLALAGMAPEFTGTEAGNGFGEALDDYLARYNSPLPQAAVWAPFRTIVRLMAEGEYNTRPMRADERASFVAGRSALNAETNRLINVAPPNEAGFWFAMTNALDAQARIGWALADDDEPDRANGIRDSSLAESLVWLAQARFPEQKLIVWTTSNHIMRSPDPLFDLGGRQVAVGQPVMGQLARIQLGNVIYSMAILSGSGSYGPVPPPAVQPIRPVVSPPPESWGGLFGFTGKSFSFLHLRPEPADANNVWVFGPRVSRALSYQLLNARWGEVFDGFLYTRVMQPSTPLTAAP